MRNIGGRLGAWVADIALLLFGLSAYLLVFGLAITVVRGFRKLHRTASGDPLNDDLPAYAHGIGFVLLLFGAVSLETLRFHTLGLALPGSPGGVVGSSVAQLLQAAVGFTGATVIMLVSIAIGLSLFLDFSWLAVAERFGGFLEGFSRRARHKREEAEDRAIGEAAAKVREAALSDERERIDEAPPVHIERTPRARQTVRAQAEGEAGTAVRRDGRRSLAASGSARRAAAQSGSDLDRNARVHIASDRKEAARLQC